MIGGLNISSRYLLASVSLIGILAYAVPEAKAQDLKEVQAQIEALQATVKALQKQVQEAQGAVSRGSDGSSQRQRQRPRLEGQVAGRAGILQRGRQIQVQGPRPTRS